MSVCEIQFDDSGDAQLRVGAAHSSAPPVVFVACSRALSRASPFFDDLFYRARDEQEPGGVLLSQDRLIIELPHDKPACLAILLYAIHARFDKMPVHPSIEALYDLTVVAHKYGATAALRPWTTAWAQAVALELQGSNDKLLMAMSIYWALGCREEFFRATRQFTESCPKFAKADLTVLQMPPDTIEHIMSIRLQTIGSLCGVFRSLIQNLLVVDEGPRWCRHATWLGSHRCESMILGSLMFCLSRAELWPLPDAAEVQYSALDLYAKLDAVVVHVIGHARGGDALDHQACNPSQHLRNAMKDIMNDIPDRLSSITFKTGQIDLAK